VNDRVLVIGASHAGVHLAASLREKGHTGSLTLVGAEPHLPYHRPPLSKAYLSGTPMAEPVALRPESFYDAKNITLLRGERVDKIDLAAGVAVTSAGVDLGFDHLALATGARARRLKLPGDDLDGLIYLRNLDNARRLLRRLDSVRRVVVVGGGFIGLEAAAVLRERHINVTLVEAGDRLMARSVSQEMSDYVLDVHRARGTRILLGTGVTAFEGTDGDLTSVTLADGSSVPADLVVIGIGVTPRTELAEQIGLTVDNGIIVDCHARTDDPRVVAVGDVTVVPHPLEPGTRLRLESVQNATDQAAAAATSILGQDPSPVSVPWFWSDQFDLKLQMAGASSKYDDIVIRGSVAKGRFTVLCYRGDRLVAGECVNSGADFGALRRALAGGISFRRDHAADESITLKALL